MAKKTNNNTTPVADIYKNGAVLFQRGFENYRQQEAQKLADHLITVTLQDETILSVTSLMNKERFRRTAFQKLCAKYPVLAEADEIIKQIIAERREIGGLTKKYDTGMVLYSMPFYSPEWKELTEWKAKIAKQEDKAQTINVTLEAVPNSPLVPEKVDD